MVNNLNSFWDIFIDLLIIFFVKKFTINAVLNLGSELYILFSNSVTKTPVDLIT